jgi:uncharacterized OB-fold protein
MSEPFTKLRVDEYAVTQVWFVKCSKCGSAYSSPVNVENGICPNCERKQMRGEE